MTLLAQLNTLETTGLIRLAAIQPELEYLFRHALVQDAAYGSLLKQDRKGLHQSTGEALEQLYRERVDEIASTLALHFEKAEQHDKAIHYFTIAGDRAKASYANNEAIQFYQSAITHIQTNPVESQGQQLCQLHENTGELLNLIGQRDVARQNFAQAIEIAARTDPNNLILQARLYRKTALSFLDQRSINEAAQNFAAGENVLQGTPSEAREWWLELIQNKIDQIWMYYTQNEPEIAEKITEQVTPWLDAYGNAAQKARFYFGLTQIRMRQLRYAVTEEMLSNMGLGLQAAQESGNLHVIAELHFGYGFVLLWYGNWGEAEKKLESAIEISERTGNVTMQARSLTYLVVLHRVRNDAQRLKEFLPQLERVLTAAGLTEYMPYIPAIKAWFALRENQLDEALSLSQEAFALLEKSPFKNPFHWLIRWPRLSVAFQQGNLTEAIEQAKEMLMPAQQKLPDDLTAALEAAISAGEAAQLDSVRHLLTQALKLAKEKGYL